VDGKVKKELREMFRSEQQKRRERHLKTKANVIQKLLDTSATKEDIEKVLYTLSLNDCLVWFGRLHLLSPNRNHLLYL
jgi:hypothetical protein